MKLGFGWRITEFAQKSGNEERLGVSCCAHSHVHADTMQYNQLMLFIQHLVCLPTPDFPISGNSPENSKTHAVHLGCADSLFVPSDDEVLLCCGKPFCILRPRGDEKECNDRCHDCDEPLADENPKQHLDPLLTLTNQLTIAMRSIHLFLSNQQIRTRAAISRIVSSVLRRIQRPSYASKGSGNMRRTIECSIPLEQLISFIVHAHEI